MVTNVQLTHEQLLVLIASIVGCDHDAIVILPLTADETSAVSVTIATDLKGATRVERILAKAALNS